MSVPSHLKDYPPNAVSIKEEEVSFTEHQRQTETEKQRKRHGRIVFLLDETRLIHSHPH